LNNNNAKESIERKISVNMVDGYGFPFSSIRNAVSPPGAGKAKAMRMIASIKCARCVVFLAAVMGLSPSGLAQQPSGTIASAKPSRADQEDKPVARTLDLDVLIQPQPVYRVKAQEWGRGLQDTGYTPQFRQPKPGEETGVRDLETDGRLSVIVVFGMSPDGSIRIGNKKFTLANIKELEAFLDEQVAYGAGGPPDKSPLWGMTDEQLLELTRLLAEPVHGAVEIQSPLITVESLGLPPNVRLTFADAAREKSLAGRPSFAPETIDLDGYSKGTAVAIVLAQYGLGFRPRRIAANSYEIEIDGGDESDNLWPAGWKTQETTAVTLPVYLKSIPVDVEDAEVSQLLQVVSDRLKIPVYRSSFALTSAGRDLDTLTYTRKNDKVSPSRLLTSIGDKLQLGFDVRVDEGGKLFLWATTSEESMAFRTRFAHVKQK